MKCYIGSAASKTGFSSRFSVHRHHLERNQHHNKHLQASWNKYGKDNFIFVPLKECKPEECIEWEQFFIDIYKPEYNKCQQAGNTLGYKHTEESIEKFSSSYLLISPAGKIVEGTNLSKLCRDNKLGLENICAVIKGKRFQHKGWTNNFENYLILKKYGSFKSYNQLVEKTFKVISPDNEVITVFGVTQFAKEHSLDPRRLSELKFRQKQEYKGWKLL